MGGVCSHLRKKMMSKRKSGRKRNREREITRRVVEEGAWYAKCTFRDRWIEQALSRGFESLADVVRCSFASPDRQMGGSK